MRLKKRTYLLDSTFQQDEIKRRVLQDEKDFEHVNKNVDMIIKNEHDIKHLINVFKQTLKKGGYDNFTQQFI